MFVSYPSTLAHLCQSTVYYWDIGNLVSLLLIPYFVKVRYLIIYIINEAFQRKLDHQMSLHANVPKVFCAVVSNVAQAIGKARGF